MSANVKSVLMFLNLLDDRGNLSLIHLAVYVALVKMIIAPVVPIDFVALGIAVVNEIHRRASDPPA